MQRTVRCRPHPFRGSPAPSLPALLMVLTLVSCSMDAVIAPMAIRAAPDKTPKMADSGLALHAKQVFWASFYEAEYEALPEVLRLLTAAYLETPEDPELALLLAHSHLWKLSERTRMAEADPRITDHALLADFYFDEAKVLAPDDTRIDGWRGGVQMALGSIHHDEARKRAGYFTLRDSVRAYPEFNAFSMAFPLGSQPRDSKRFTEAVDLMVENLESCSGIRIDLAAFDYTSAMSGETDQGAKRVCWSTALVPHNFEGFFLNAGDLLTKAGHRDAAVRAYETARLTDGYSSWRYAPVLEARIANVDARVAAFAKAESEAEEPEMMFQSDYACAACHAR